MKIHFIGIGGIGVSSLAQYYLAKGFKVSGSDLRRSEITKTLRKRGVKIYIGHKEENLPNDTDLVVYTSAIPKGNPEFVKSQKLKIKSQSYAQALGELTKKYFTIAVSGTHGKSTTTAMISLILEKAGFNPTVIIGTKLKEFGDTNFRSGSKLPVASLPRRKPKDFLRGRQLPVLVIEADEYRGAFLNYFPGIIVLTNIEREHFDYFKNLRFVLKTYKEYISHLPKDGFLIFNKDDKNILKLKCQISPKQSLPEGKFSTSYGAGRDATGQANVKSMVKGYSLKQKESKELRKILKIPGEHNVSNALAALSVARVLKIPDKITFGSLSNYRGAWRRFEVFPAFLQDVPYTLVSDYGHHPTEIKATLRSAREKFGRKRIICIFQPHQYQRTKILFRDFIKSFDNADYLILNEIYGVAGREKGGKISSDDLATSIKRRWRKEDKKVVFIRDIKKIPCHLKDILKQNDVVIIMGAGDIYNLVLKLTQSISSVSV